MCKNWKNVTIGDLIENKSRRFDFDQKKEVVFINTGDVLKGKFLHHKYISKIGLPGQAKKAIQPQDILFSEIRPANGRFAMVDFDVKDYVVSTKFMVLSKISNDVDLEYLYQIITCPTTLRKFQLIAESRSGTFPQITFDVISHLPFKLPPLPEQKAIAHILGTLDDKIELNRKMNETLEAMAQAMFKSWFVDFDPVMDNALAKGNEIPEELKAKAERRKAVLESGKYKPLPKDIKALFPASFEYNDELGKWIPEGWHRKVLYDTANYINGASFKSKDFSQTGNGKPVIKIAELKSGITAQTKFTEADFDNKYLVNKGDLFYSWSGSPDTSLNTFIWSGKQGWLNQHIFAVKTDSIQKKVFVFNLLNYLKPTLIAIAKNKQTTGLGHVTVKDMKNLHIATCNNMSDIIQIGLENIFKRQVKLQEEIVEVTKSRDLLLSQLISGKTRLPESFIQQFESQTETVSQ